MKDEKKKFKLQFKISKKRYHSEIVLDYFIFKYHEKIKNTSLKPDLYSCLFYCIPNVEIFHSVYNYITNINLNNKDEDFFRLNLFYSGNYSKSIVKFNLPTDFEFIKLLKKTFTDVKKLLTQKNKNRNIDNKNEFNMLVFLKRVESNYFYITEEQAASLFLDNVNVFNN